MGLSSQRRLYTWKVDEEAGRAAVSSAIGREPIFQEPGCFHRHVAEHMMSGMYSLYTIHPRS